MTNRRKESPMIMGQTPLAGFGTVRGDGDEPMTAEQAAVLRDLAERADEPMDGGLTRAQADERIEALRDRLGED